MFHLPPFFPFLLLLLCCPQPARTSHNSTLSDQHALLAFRNSLDLQSRDSLHNWNANHSLCTWRGVICSSRPNREVRVLSLNLTGMALVGPISPFLGNLSFLRVFDLPDNNFDGQIPYELVRLFRLRFLRLSSNSLSGSIPFEIGLLPNLEKVELGKNQLTGEIPSSLANISSLTILNLGHNRLHGRIPLQLASLSQLTKLVLADNNFTGLLASTNALRGSIGYMAPEYGAGGKVWANGDVYSYGILLLELLTRRRPTDNIFVEGMNLPKWVHMHFPNSITEVVDSNLLRDANESEKSQVQTCLTQLMQVGLVCASESPQERPTMVEVVKRLDVARHTLLGMPRAFQLPVDISTLLMNTSRASNDQLGSDKSWSSSTG